MYYQPAPMAHAGCVSVTGIGQRKFWEHFTWAVYLNVKPRISYAYLIPRYDTRTVLYKKNVG